MALVSLKEIVDRAFEHKYAVGAFNVINLEFAEIIVKTAEMHNSPVILNIAEAHMRYVNLDILCPAVITLANRASVPAALNLDHGLTFETIVRAVRHGFTGIMFDGSALELEDNIGASAEIVRLCAGQGIGVEAELGAVGGDEGGGLYSNADPARFTDVSQAKEFVQRTGIDMLAVAIGNSHGKYKGTPKLDFERLEKIRDAAGVPLVLHGGTGIPANDFRTAISLGISKINFFTGMAQAALDATKRFVNQGDADYNHYPDMLVKVQGAVAETIGEQMEIFGSCGKVW